MQQHTNTATLWQANTLIFNELFGAERLEQHALSLAQAQEVAAAVPEGQSLSARLNDNKKVLLGAYQSIVSTVKADSLISSAAEWLLDNYHLVEEQIREIQNDLPPSYYKQLPKLASGHLVGYPRVLGIAWAFVAHTDSLFDTELLCRFVSAYQTVQPLTMGELWAIFISLRILLVENLRRAADTMTASRKACLEADSFADLLLSKSKRSAKAVARRIKQYKHKPLSQTFAVQLLQRMRDQDMQASPSLLWLEGVLKQQKATPEEMVQQEHQQQGALNVTVRNIITSMRRLSQTNWMEVFEQLSLVDVLLNNGDNKDVTQNSSKPSTFASMDFPTRDLYRKAIEELAQGSQQSELAVTQAALLKAKETSEDVGFYLIAEGRLAFEQELAFKPALKERPSRLLSAMGIKGYAGSVALVATVVIMLPFLALNYITGHSLPTSASYTATPLALLLILGFLPALDVAISLLNWMLTGGLDATSLAGLKLEEGIPAHLRTLVVIPALLSSREEVKELVSRLEIHHLTCRENEVYFALLSDWSDAKTETVAGDDALLSLAQQEIERLNHIYSLGQSEPRFLLLHRRRLYNPKQGVWMGWERKRGKLHELNRLLRGATDTSYTGVEETLPQDVRYVVTLDSDTRLPLGAVRRLVGKMAHPLNQPKFDVLGKRVVQGYGVLQPRITPSLLSQQNNSLFQRLFSNTGGLEPYTAAVSDLYQDLFAEGSYAGKGIYDVDAFEQALAGRIPENSLLSHDLFEGLFVRAGLVSDIEVIEDFPASYAVAAQRQHRWARGDWQLLPWIFGQQGEDLSPMGKWKLLDNLRRTLSAPACLAALLFGFTLPLKAALLWLALIVTALVLPLLLPIVSSLALFVKRMRVTYSSHFSMVNEDIWLATLQGFLMLAFLPHQAWLMLDAEMRTLFRLFVSHKNLLEWQTAAASEKKLSLGYAGLYKYMAASLALAAVTGLIVLPLGLTAQCLAAPFVLLWLAAPALAQWVSAAPALQGKAFKQSPEHLNKKESQALREIARRTWRFFETFVTASDNHLPPDNFQEDPYPVVGHRTSPTNIGLYLLAVVAANDLGWTGRQETLQRLEATMATMSQLQRYRGHFYNWYETQDLRLLEPPYISSVDSGNLAGHLIVLANACDALGAQPFLSGLNLHAFAAITDNLNLSEKAFHKAFRLSYTCSSLHSEFVLTLASMRQSIEAHSKAGLLAALPETLKTLTILKQQAVLLLDLAQTLPSEAFKELVFWTEATLKTINSHLYDLKQTEVGLHAESLRFAKLAAEARAMSEAMDFGFLLNKERKLLSIGYLPHEDRLDESCYDLLASEARLASFVAIAKGELPAEHWFRLGRALTHVKGGTALISWSGSMFEYLMPSLVMETPMGSLLEHSLQGIVERQMSYGKQLGLPWGISESAYNVRDNDLTYQYSNFGVPGLGLKRGLSENRVIAPYATALAAMVQPVAALRNFERLAKLKALGSYGFYEALDYTFGRVPKADSRTSEASLISEASRPSEAGSAKKGNPSPEKTRSLSNEPPMALVKAFMAHHQGMSLIALTNTLMNGLMRSRFHNEPMVQAAAFLLQERMPRELPISFPRAEEVAMVKELTAKQGRQLHSANYATPEAHLLSNGRYQIMLSSAGSGYSRWQGLNITRWQEDVTRDDWGSYLFIRDRQNGEVWSAGLQPSGVAPSDYSVIFAEDKAVFSRRDGTVSTTLEVLLSPEADAEVRRVSLVNNGSRTRQLEVTSYAELVLAPASADSAHPAFSKLFVQTAYLAKQGAIVATRRQRSPNEPSIWAAHLAVVEGTTVGELQLETDRARFIGRGGNLRSAVAVHKGQALSNTVGTVLDPIFALRRCVSIPPGATVRIAFWTVVASTQAELLQLIDRHQESSAFQRAATLAWVQAQVQLRHLGLEADEASLFQRLGSHLLYSNPLMRPASSKLKLGLGGQAGLWAYGISGDKPIVLLRLSSTEELALVRQLLKAHAYLQIKQMALDLVILNERSTSYVQDLQTDLETLVRVAQPARQQPGEASQTGGVFVLRADRLEERGCALLTSVARTVLDASRGSLYNQLNRLKELSVVQSVARKKTSPLPKLKQRLDTPDLEFYNGLGGFSDDGKEYVTLLAAGQQTPAPWLNVVANPHFGFQVSVEGCGYTWSLNSRENQLTPWSNDPVSDRSGEVFYVRDEETGQLWSPTAQPIRSATEPYLARHGQGYSQFEHIAYGIELELLQFVPLKESIKISRLMVRNTSNRTRRLSVTAYVEWVLGQNRSANAPYLVTELEPTTGALLAHNPWATAFVGRKAFIDMEGKQSSWTGDRKEFIGRHGTLEAPLALVGGGGGKKPLSKQVGAGLDPCGAMQTCIELKPNECSEVVFFLGEGDNTQDAVALLQTYRTADLDLLFQEVETHWEQVLGTVQVRTPDRAMDVMLNRWLLYQNLACRVWARSAFYQASGAYGFRDQLQDGMALAITRPDLTREHLLRAAGRQFIEGDVQHWWLPTNGAGASGQGVRTRISDDRIWLAYTTAHYVKVSGDIAILDEVVPFLEGAALAEGEHDAFYMPSTSSQSATLFEHCALGLEQSLQQMGSHGLPLIGTGDWNDGMNRVGEKGLGESVWLGWFLYTTLNSFAALAQSLNQTARAEVWHARMQSLKQALEHEAWDGAWYRRGYFDDGTPLGSTSSSECRIDAIAQSWSVISGAGGVQRQQQAMAALEEHLIKENDALALLFAPPFDSGPLEPGYVKGYPAGLRENGGQYTHAATWSIIAFTLLGQGDKAAQLFALLNPVNHSNTRAKTSRYKVEPYVVAADVYSTSPHVGRGGWTWYTGAAGWLYRAGLESILGFTLEGSSLQMKPCIPAHWPSFEITFKYHNAVYDITVENPEGVQQGVLSLTLNGLDLPEGHEEKITLETTGSHTLLVLMGSPI